MNPNQSIGADVPGLPDVPNDSPAANGRNVSLNNPAMTEPAVSTPTNTLETSNASDNRPTLITGGAGFVGCNLADALLSQGRRVVIYDNLSRAGVEQNWQWLQTAHGSDVTLMQADIRDRDTLARAVSQCGEVFHFAAQVAVTTSLDDPLRDFEINAGGTLNLLEAIRRSDAPHPLVFTSTNKVYGELEDVALRRTAARYEPLDASIRAHGIGEARRLDFHSPYGCSKGAADQYVLDYARTYGLPTLVFRMSCIYGPRQFGTEDQGWVAHFLIRALDGQPITLYGDGRQVRDVLFVGDLVRALQTAQAQMGALGGQTYNIGGGANQVTSLLELVERIGAMRGKRPDVCFSAWRPGDQRYYVSDTRKFEAATGWKPEVSIEQGVTRLYEWLCRSRSVQPSDLRIAANERE